MFLETPYIRPKPITRRTGRSRSRTSRVPRPALARSLGQVEVSVPPRGDPVPRPCPDLESRRKTMPAPALRVRALVQIRAEPEGAVTLVRKPTHSQEGAQTWRKTMTNPGQRIHRPRTPRNRPSLIWDSHDRFGPTASPRRGAVAGFADCPIEPRNHISQRLVHGRGRCYPRSGTWGGLPAFTATARYKGAMRSVGPPTDQGGRAPDRFGVVSWNRCVADQDHRAGR